MRSAAMYILHWLMTWALVSSVSSSVPKSKLTPRSTSQSKMASASVVADGAHAVVQRRLAEALLVDAHGVDVLVIEDGVVHAHAALIEDAHDGLLLLHLRGQRATQLGLGGRQPGSVEVAHVRRIVLDLAALHPSLECLASPFVAEVLAPDGAVRHACLGHRGVQVQQAHQAWPLAAPVGRGQDRSALGLEAGQHVVAVLPDRLGHDDG